MINCLGDSQVFANLTQDNMNGIVGSYFIMELEKCKEFLAFTTDDDDENDKKKWGNVIVIWTSLCQTMIEFYKHM
jgi:hypothetical protein